MDLYVVSMLFNKSKYQINSFLILFDLFLTKRILSTISIYAPLTSVDFHPNGSLVAVGTMGQNAAIYDLRDPKNKLAHLVNSEHGNVYSLRFETGQTTTTPPTNPQRPTTLPQEVWYNFHWFKLIWFK